MHRVVVLAVLTSACAHGYVAIGYDAAKSSHGGMSSTVTERASTGSVGFGVGGRTAGVELRLQSYDLDPAPAGDRFIAASGALEVRLVALRVGPIAVFGHGGPEVGVVFDKQMLDTTEGIGMRAGGGVELGFKGGAVWVDAARSEMTFGGAVVNGRGDRDVVAIGVRIGGS